MPAPDTSRPLDDAFRNIRRLRLGIIAFALALAVGYASHTILDLADERRETVSNAVTNAETLLVSLDEHLGRTVHAAESAIALAASQLEAALAEREFDTAAVYNSFHRIQRGAPQLNGIGFVDAAGEVSFYTRFLAARLNVRDRDYFEFHRHDPSTELRLGEPSPSRATGETIVPVTRRVNHLDGRFAGVVVGTLDAAYFESFYARMPARIGALAVFSMEGGLLARFPKASELIRDSLAEMPALSQRIAARTQGWDTRPAEGGRPARHVVHRLAADVPFILVIAIPDATIFASWRKRVEESAIEVVLVALVLALFSGLLLRATDRQGRLAQGLQESEARYRDLVDASSDWHWEMGPDLRLSAVRDQRGMSDPRFESVLGRTRAEIVDTSTPHLAQHLDDLAHHRPYRDFVYRRILNNGEIRYTKSSGKPVFDAKGKFLGYRGTATDVTATILAEERATASRKLLDEAIETLHDGFVLFDAQDRFVQCNSRFREIYAESAALLVPGAHYETILRHAAGLGQFPEAAGRVDKWLENALAYHYIMASTRPQRLPGGRWVEVREVKLADGGSVGIHIDITDARQAQERLRESEERLRSIAANLTSVILEFSVDARGAVRQTFISERCSAVLGYTPEEVIADPNILVRIIEPDSLGVYCRTLAEAEKTMAPVEIDYRFRRRDGAIRWARSLLRPRRGASGEILWDGTIHDATDMKAAEAQHHELENQLRHLQRIEAVGTLAGGMAHEINNKLVPIVTFSELMLMQAAADSPSRKPLHMIHEAAGRIRDLVARILTMSRNETPSPSRVSLEAIVVSTIGLLRVTLRPNIELDLQAAPLPDVLADAGQIEQVLVNLCTNAAHAMGGKAGSIRIRLDGAEITGGPGSGPNTLAPGHYARLQIIDNGSGMSPQTVQRIFEPFFTTKGVGEGTGLGLAIVHGIIAGHRGRISVESEPGQGTTFTILLPLAPSEARAPDDVVNATAGATQNSLGTSPELPTTEIRRIALPEERRI